MSDDVDGLLQNVNLDNLVSVKTEDVVDSVVDAQQMVKMENKSKNPNFLG